MKAPDYCTQNNGDCPTCSLSNYGRDCMNNKIPTSENETFTVGDVAGCLGCHERNARKLLNDAGADPRLDEYAENPGELISRTLVIDLVALRSGDRVGRKLVELLHKSR